MKIDEGVITVGASNANSNDEYHTFVFVANPDEPDAEGTYFEIDDQVHGGYRNVKSVNFYKNGAKIILMESLAQEYEHNEISVVINNTNDFILLKNGIAKLCNNNYQINEINENL